MKRLKISRQASEHLNLDYRVNSIHNTLKQIKFCFVFFCVGLGVGCELEDRVQIEQIDYEDHKALGVTFSTNMDVEKLRVFIGDASQTSVIGVIVRVNDNHSFTPVLPFTPGQTYTVRKADTLVLASFTIPNSGMSTPNEVVGIYPSGDTVPENLLKMYFEFAQPMQAVGNALDFITVTHIADSTESKPFLQLESELWNKEHTVLTLWLDPGRIKTGLIPNRERGLPLGAGQRYEIKIDSSWKSRQGTPLKQHYTKVLYVGPRDDKKPRVDAWQLQIPDAESRNALRMDFGAPMDGFLALETMSIQTSKGTEIEGNFTLENNESVLSFIPTKIWNTGSYKILVQSRLEDLAGNNLNHLFDMDIKNGAKVEVSKGARNIAFSIR